MHDLSSADFMPHGMCYLWQPGILGLHVGSDALITLAYFSIPFTLLYFVRRRQDLRSSWVLVCFAVFIIACGATHLMEIWTIWHPDYWLSGGLKAVTALASVLTAILLAKFMPAALRMPTPAVLEAANAELAREVAERRHVEAQVRKLNESLEARIAERTGALRDANDALRSEMRERRRAEELLTRTLASIRDGVVVTDESGEITFINEAAAQLIGQAANDSLGSSVPSQLQLVRPATREPLRLSGGLEDGEAAPIPEDLLLIGAGGREIPIDLRTQPLQGERARARGVVYTLRDCSERHEAEAVQQQMAALVESADDAILVEDLDGLIRSWNSGARRLLGYEAAEIIGQSILRLQPEELQDEEAEILDNFRRGRPVAHHETLRRRKDGSLVNVSLTISPIRDRAGAMIGISKIMRDISERKHYIEQLRTLNSELERRVLARTAELKERDALLQEVHHRVKNNLQVISSLINMQVRTLRDEPTRAALQQCRSRVETMAQIHEMLYQSKSYASVPFEKYARELTVRVLSASGVAAENVVIHHDMQELSLAVDKAIPCALILNELLSNALKHAFPGRSGTIRLELREHSAGRVLLGVSDDGVGIAPEFEPQRSSSLGLQLVATLARQLDGELEIVRQPGCSFRVIFPSGSSCVDTSGP
jgi:PAS domain S-box-containing protein